MYTPGKVLGACTTAATVAGCATLPVTGMNSATQIALALAAGLAVWAVVYMAAAKLNKR
jgi:zinc transporter ZupT